MTLAPRCERGFIVEAHLLCSYPVAYLQFQKGVNSPRLKFKCDSLPMYERYFPIRMNFLQDVDKYLRIARYVTWQM